MGLEEAMCPREALLLVVKVVQVVFHVSTSNHSIFEKNHFEIDNCIITRYIFVNSLVEARLYRRVACFYTSVNTFG